MADFERFIFVDWSASSTPKVGKSSIWIGSCLTGSEINSFNTDLTGYAGGQKIIDNWDCSLKSAKKKEGKENFFENSFVANPPTRRAAFAFLKEILEQDKKKTLMGFDFGFGYPYQAYGAEKEKLGGCWKCLWKKLTILYDEDDQKVDNQKYPHYEMANRWNLGEKGLFFWGKPNKIKGSINNIETVENNAKKRREENIVNNFRMTEKRVMWSGVKSQWQLYGAGSVGSQTLLGIPYVEKLRKCLGEKVAKVWPFETNFGKDLKDFEVLLCEVHFGAIFRVQERIARKNDALQCQNKNYELPKAYPKDRIQVEEMCRFFASQEDNYIKKLLSVDCACVGEDEKEIAQTKEGWILGVPLCLQTSEPCKICHKKK